MNNTLMNRIEKVNIHISETSNSFLTSVDRRLYLCSHHIHQKTNRSRRRTEKFILRCLAERFPAYITIVKFADSRPARSGALVYTLNGSKK